MKTTSFALLAFLCTACGDLGTAPTTPDQPAPQNANSPAAPTSNPNTPAVTSPPVVTNANTTATPDYPTLDSHGWITKGAIGCTLKVEGKLDIWYQVSSLTATNFYVASNFTDYFHGSTQISRTTGIFSTTTLYSSGTPAQLEDLRVGKLVAYEADSSTTATPRYLTMTIDLTTLVLTVLVKDTSAQPGWVGSFQTMCVYYPIS